MIAVWRVTTAALVAALLVACDPTSSAPPSQAGVEPTGPASVIPPTPAATSTTAPGQTAAPTERPPTCASLATNPPHPSPDFTVWTPAGGFSLGLDLTRISSILDPSEVIEFEGGEPYLDDPIRAVGGAQMALDPHLDSAITLLDASATLMIQGREHLMVEGSVGAVPKTERPGFLFDMPDVRAKAAEFAVEWSDDCFTYRAEKVWSVQMARAALAAACPDTAEEGVEHWGTLTEPPVEVGDLSVDLFPTDMGFLWSAGAFGSQGNDPLYGWDGIWEPTTGRADGTLRVAAGNDDLQLASLTASFYRRRHVLEWRDGTRGEPSRVFFASALPFAHRSLDLLLAPRPGHYLVSLSVEWSSPCARGTSVGPVTVDIE